jgi:hypothetical protein
MWQIERIKSRSDSSGGRSDKIIIHPRSPYLVTTFHAVVVAYYIIMNVLMGIVSIRLYEAGHPVTKMFLGGVTQFFTTWNQVNI